MKGASLQEKLGKKVIKKSSNNSYNTISMAQAQELLVPLTATALPPNSNLLRRKGIFQELQANSATPQIFVMFSMLIISTS